MASSWASGWKTANRRQKGDEKHEWCRTRCHLSSLVARVSQVGWWLPRTAAVNKCSLSSQQQQLPLYHYYFYYPPLTYSLTDHSLPRCLLLPTAAALYLYIGTTLWVARSRSLASTDPSSSHIRCIPQICVSFTLFKRPRSSLTRLCFFSTWTTAWKTLRTLHPRPGRPPSWVPLRLGTTPRASPNGWSLRNKQISYLLAIS